MSGRDLLTDERRLCEDLCAREYLAAGFQRVSKNQGAPGIDGVTMAEFETRLDEELSRLTVELESWTYETSPVRRVEIPKPGGQGIRVLGVPTVRDRVVQATLKLLLEPIFEPLISANSYGFRPGRNQGQAKAARSVPCSATHNRCNARSSPASEPSAPSASQKLFSIPHTATMPGSSNKRFRSSLATLGRSNLIR